jgi:hypothetical protein
MTAVLAITLAVALGALVGAVFVGIAIMDYIERRQ